MNKSRREWIEELASAALLAGAPPVSAQNVRYVRPDDVAQAFWEPYMHAVFDALPIRPSDRVMDAGCGAGDHLPLLASRCAQVVGVDLKQDRVGQAREFAASRGFKEKVNVVQGDIYRLNFPDQSFDVIWASHVIHGLPHIVEGVKALARKLKPSGYLLIRENRMSANFLPYHLGIGEPGWEVRTDLVWLQWYTTNIFTARKAPKGWMGLFYDAGIRKVTPRSFVHECFSPLTPVQIKYLAWHLERRFEWPGMSKADLEVLRRLLDPDGPHTFWKREDLYWTQLSTVYVCEL